MRMQWRWTVLAVLAGACCVAPALWAVEQQKAEPPSPAATAPDKRSEPIVARLERLEPSPLILKAPEGVAGEFTVAREAPGVDFAILPGQWEGANLWSAWGDSLRASNGKFYATIGDHDRWGTTYLYEVDPGAGTVRLVLDVNAALGLSDQHYAPGKIHAPVLDPGDGWLYLVTYPGTFGGLDKNESYSGDWFFRYHMASGAVEPLGVLVPNSAVAVAEYHAPTKTIYGLSQGVQEPRQSAFYAYDLAGRRLVFHGGPQPGMTRALMVAADGRAYYGDRDNMLVRYDPRTKTTVALDQQIPGSGKLRAVSRPAAAGVIHAISSDGVVFAFDPGTEEITWSARAFTEGGHYITTCRLDPTERYLYYVPGAHGSAWQSGAPVIQFDLKTRRPKVLAFPNQYMLDKKAYNLGGTYGIALSPDGSRLFICWNGARPEAKQKGFGLCSVMIVHIPESERR